MKAIVATAGRAEQAYGAIQESIIDGTLAPGAHLVQEELAAKLGVSRQPIQQAMALLKNDGLVVETGARGLRVAPLDLVDTAHRYQIRAALEQLAVRLATNRAAASPKVADAMRREGEALMEAGEHMVRLEKHIDAVTNDIKFHEFLCRSSGNPLIHRTAETSWLYVRRVMIAVVRFADRGPIVWREHREILDAMCAGQTEEAVARVTAHVLGAGGALTTALARMQAEQNGDQTNS
ncbi:GntR family transcriptional regulator [Rhodobacteraceae bacterium NNCM2]|nr:GntR family transcriptional regulator [Coraliihabitans acroporae]